MNSTKRLMLMVALIIVALVAVACDTTPDATDPTLDTAGDTTDDLLGTPDPALDPLDGTTDDTGTTGDTGGDTAGTMGDGELNGQIVMADGSTAELPEDATVTVQLVDVSSTNETAEVLAESTIQDVNTFPVEWSLDYDPGMISEDAVVAVQAVVTDGNNNLLYANMNQYRVLTAGNPTDDVEVMLEPMQSQ